MSGSSKSAQKRRKNAAMKSAVKAMRKAQAEMGRPLDVNSVAGGEGRQFQVQPQASSVFSQQKGRFLVRLRRKLGKGLGAAFALFSLLISLFGIELYTAGPSLYPPNSVDKDQMCRRPFAIKNEMKLTTLSNVHPIYRFGKTSALISGLIMNRGTREIGSIPAGGEAPCWCPMAVPVRQGIEIDIHVDYRIQPFPFVSWLSWPGSEIFSYALDVDSKGEPYWVVGKSLMKQDPKFRSGQ